MGLVFYGGILLREIKIKPEDGKCRYKEKTVQIPKSAMKTLWVKSKERTISKLKETPFASKQQESFNDPANHAGEQILSGMENTAQNGAGLAYRVGKNLAKNTVREIQKKQEKSRTAESIRKMDISTEKQIQKSQSRFIKNAPKKTAHTVKSGSKAARSSMKASERSVKTAQKSVKTAEQVGKASVKAARYTAKTVSQTAQVTAKTIKLAVPVMKAAAKAAATGIKAAAKAIAAAVEAMVAGMKALAAVIAAGGWVAVLIIVLVCAVAMMIAFFLNSADSFAQQNGEKLIASDTGWQETGIFQ